MPRILIIDDDERILRSLERILSGEGYEVGTAANGRLAMKAFEAHPADLVITDVNMPEMDGLEVIMSFRERRPDIPVIAISGGGALSKELLLDNAEVLGAVTSIQKPFDMDELLAAVARVLGEGDRPLDASAS